MKIIITFETLQFVGRRLSDRLSHDLDSHHCWFMDFSQEYIESSSSKKREGKTVKFTVQVIRQSSQVSFYDDCWYVLLRFIRTWSIDVNRTQGGKFLLMWKWDFISSLLCATRIAVSFSAYLAALGESRKVCKSFCDIIIWFSCADENTIKQRRGERSCTANDSRYTWRS